MPRRIIVPVEIQFSTSLVAVPAFSRVEPVRASGPVCMAMTHCLTGRVVYAVPSSYASRLLDSIN